jgi:hypothetical protein
MRMLKKNKGWKAQEYPVEKHWDVSESHSTGKPLKKGKASFAGNRNICAKELDAVLVNQQCGSLSPLRCLPWKCVFFFSRLKALGEEFNTVLAKHHQVQISNRSIEELSRFQTKPRQGYVLQRLITTLLKVVFKELWSWWYRWDHSSCHSATTQLSPSTTTFVGVGQISRRDESDETLVRAFNSIGERADQLESVLVKMSEIMSVIWMNPRVLVQQTHTAFKQSSQFRCAIIHREFQTSQQASMRSHFAVTTLLNYTDSTIEITLCFNIQIKLLTTYFDNASFEGKQNPQLHDLVHAS